MQSNNLDTLRSSIDDIDKSILELFYKRMDICKQVAQYKKDNNLPVFQSGREQQIFDKIRSMSPENLEDASVSLFASIMEISKVLQQREIFSDIDFIKSDVFDISGSKKFRVGCPGTIGANSHTATLQIFPNDEIKFYTGFEDVFKAILNNEIDYGIVPIHNSTAGSVIQTYELLEKYDFYINATTKVEISHCIATREGVNKEDIKYVYSHPQALSQCSSYIKEHSYIAESYSNTALAAEMVSKSDEPFAAICSETSANEFGLKILKKGINDVYPNYTKFICISKNCQISENADTISIVLTLPNECGSLYKMLTKFFVNNLNMQKIESRPLKNGSFDVKFHIDFEGNINNPKVCALLHDLKNNIESFKFIGNYSEI
jgi:chorismate mutase/prephenate dehydratase